MNWIFGENPVKKQEIHSTSEKGSDELKHGLIEEIEQEITDRMRAVTGQIWLGLESKSKTGTILKQSQNSIMKATISEMEYRGVAPYQEYECLVTFSDVPGEDSFTVKADMDHDLASADDVYSVIVRNSGTFSIARGHPDENGMLHFRAVDHHDADRLLDYLERCMDVVPENSLMAG